MINRSIEKEVRSASKKIGIISIVGPRQSGKTTLAKKIFPTYQYCNLEDLNTRDQISVDPAGFLRNHSDGLILDEVQKYPDILSYIQVNIDESFKPAKFIITGSENLLLSEKVSQSLAGRVSIFTLLPLSIEELTNSNELGDYLPKTLLKGFYPRIYSQNLTPKDLYPDYITTYVERDVRQIKNIGDLSNFQRFLQLLAGRVGQVINLSELGNDVGVNYKTIESWISILEATYIAFKFQPYFENFGKRIIKSPKIFFYDTGLLCYLLGIDSENELNNHYALGNIFENMVVADLKKQLFNTRSSSQVYFWRDSEKNEVDIVIKNGTRLIPIEVKVGSSYNSDYLKGIKIWQDLEKNTQESYLIYNGERTQVLKTTLLNWKSLPAISDVLK